MTSGSAPEKTERRFQGIAVAPGIAHAEAVLHRPDEDEIPHRDITPEELPGEIARFESALISTRAELLEMQQRIADAIGAKDASIFDAHLLVVEDRTLIDEVLRNLDADRINVESVFQRVSERYCRTLSAIDDPYLRERVVDIEDVSRRVMRHLLGKQPHQVPSLDRPHILLAPDLTPSDTAMINRETVLGFATEAGSKTSHSAIMAKSMEIPAVVGVHGVFGGVLTGDDVLLDGYNGLLILNPSAETLREYGRIEQRKEEVAGRLELIRDTLSATSDGRRVILSANIELPDEMDDVVDSGAEGVGLYRTEYLFLNRDSPPSEDEQFESYKAVAVRSQPHAVIIRTLDIGGDKLWATLGHNTELNPFLGCRAIRFCLQHPAIFKTQLRAILRASAHGTVRIMYPMISGLTEVRAANALLAECKTELAAEGMAFNDDIEVGIMVEIPSAALAADQIGREVRFFSIGTNDLVQYSIAVDRVNDRIAHLYEPSHPAVLRLIKMVVEGGRKHGIWTGVCGEMAGDVLMTPLLLGLGIDELSVTSSAVPRVKKAVQSLNLETCRQLAIEAVDLDDPAEIARRCASVARSHYAELID